MPPLPTAARVYAGVLLLVVVYQLLPSVRIEVAGRRPSEAPLAAPPVASATTAAAGAARRSADNTNKMAVKSASSAGAPPPPAAPTAAQAPPPPPPATDVDVPTLPAQPSSTGPRPTANAELPLSPEAQKDGVPSRQHAYRQHIVKKGRGALKGAGILAGRQATAARVPPCERTALDLNTFVAFLRSLKEAVSAAATTDASQWLQQRWSADVARHQPSGAPHLSVHLGALQDRATRALAESFIKQGGNDAMVAAVDWPATIVHKRRMSQPGKKRTVRESEELNRNMLDDVMAEARKVAAGVPDWIDFMIGEVPDQLHYYQRGIDAAVPLALLDIGLTLTFTETSTALGMLDGRIVPGTVLLLRQMLGGGDSTQHQTLALFTWATFTGTVLCPLAVSQNQHLAGYQMVFRVVSRKKTKAQVRHPFKPEPETDELLGCPASRRVRLTPDMSFDQFVTATFNALGGVGRHLRPVQWLVSKVWAEDRGLPPADSMALEFGVYRGNTLRKVSMALKDKKHAGVIAGFDSFIGLPDDWRPNVRKGAFGERGTAYKMARQNVPIHTQLVKGWFQDTTPEFLSAHRNEAIGYLHVDGDLFVSAVLNLYLLDKHIEPGTWILYDELINFPEFWDHEILATYLWLRMDAPHSTTLCALAQFETNQPARWLPVDKTHLVQSALFRVLER